MKNSQKTRTLKRKVLISMILLVIFQVLAISTILLITDTSEKLDSNKVEILNNSVSYKAQSFEAEMFQWSDFSDWLAQTDWINSEIEAQTGIPTSELIKDAAYRKQILNFLSDSVLIHLRQRVTTGAFLILDDGTDSANKDAVYLRDLNPLDTSESNHDILVEAGLGKNGFAKGFTLDIYWAELLKLGDNRDFYNKPMQAALSNPDLDAADLGYWSSAMRIVENDIPVITYTVPLLDSTHTPYGVIGIDLTLDYLKNYLNGSEISIAKNASFYLGKSVNAEGPETFENIYTDNVYHSKFLESNEHISLSPSGRSSKIKIIRENGDATGQVCYYSPLKLYNTNTPFVDETWIVAGIVNEPQLYEASRSFMVAMTLALSVSLTIGIFCSVVTTSIMFKPLHQLMQGLKSISFATRNLPRTGIIEIDEFAGEIERLRHNAFLAGSKAADIIDMSNISLGVYEYNRQIPGEVFCTRKFFELTELPMTEWNENYMPAPLFFELLNTFRAKSTADSENSSICSFTTQNGSTRYLEIKSVIRESEELYVYMDVTAQIHEKNKIKHERDYDVLTNLFNRRAFVRLVSKLVDGHQIRSGVLSMWDLDNLKYINDTYGHDMGDKYICILADEFHRMDDAQAITARISGDEFMVFLYDRDPEEMAQKLESIHASFLKRRLRLPDGDEIPVSVSAGIAVYGQDSDIYESLVKQADFAMYEVKHFEKGAIRRFHKETYERDYILVQGIGELNKLLEEERIHFVFQPIVDIRKKEIFAYEALMRPDSTILYNPELLLRVAEKQSKLRQIERLTWFHALESFSAQTPENSSVKLFLNSISNQCLSDDEFQALETLYGDSLANVVMEITENSQPDEEANHKKTAFCDKHHMGIAMDDYGSGYSTNSSLINGSFDFVKIDMTMIRNIHLSQEKQTFVANVIEYCHQCSTSVIAEGVETFDEYRIVELLGADYIQGYFLSRPAARISDIHIRFTP